MGKRGPKPGEGGAPVYWTDELLDVIAEELTEYASEHTNLILEGYCVEYYKKYGKRLWPQRLTEFAERHENLAESLQFAKSALGVNIFSAGMTGEGHPTMVKLGMINVPGWSDKTKIEHSGEIKSAVQIVKLPELDEDEKDDN